MELITILLNAGANANLQNIDYKTPLHFAVAYGNSEAAGILYNLGHADLDMKDINGVTPRGY